MDTAIKLFLEKGFLVESDLGDLFREIYSIDKDILASILGFLVALEKDKFLSKEVFSKHLDRISIALANFALKNKTKDGVVQECLALIKENLVITKIIQSTHTRTPLPNTESTNIQTPIESEKKEQHNVNILASYNLPSRKITVMDFVKHFKSRFLTFKNFLQEHRELQNLVSINKLPFQKQNVSIIGIVFSKRWTKNKNLLLEVEDLTGRVNVLVNSAKEEVAKKARNIMLDEVVGFKCVGNQEILFVNDIVFPETKNNISKKSPTEIYAAFISDLHTGSINFLENNFKKFIKWLNAEIGSENQKNLASKVKYLFIVGDTVDGIGVYPNQEDLLDILDIKQQYEKLASLLGEIRRDIKIILCPGQHDCVRVAEPQPPLDRNIATPLYNLPNLFLVSNPSLVNIASTDSFPGFNVLMYHGASLHTFVNGIEELRFTNAHHNPSKIIKYVLQKRHLAPTHSSIVYIPSEGHDPLAINTVPDIITTGEIHRSEIARYNNILSIQCSCWQKITPFEEKVGNEPDPCKVPLLNLHTNEVNILDFS